MSNIIIVNIIGGSHWEKKLPVENYQESELSFIQSITRQLQNLRNWIII